MTKLTWDANSGRYETGVDRGVFYPVNSSGVAWTGLTSVQESPSGAEDRPRYVDGIRVGARRGPEQFSGTIEAYSYPDQFYLDVLSQRRAKPFGFSYRTQTENSYKIHVVYNVFLEPSGYDYDQEEPSTFSWAFTTLPVAIPNAKPTAHLFIEADQVDSAALQLFEDILYGSEEKTASLPSPSDLVTIFDS